MQATLHYLLLRYKYNTTPQGILLLQYYIIIENQNIHLPQTQLLTYSIDIIKYYTVKIHSLVYLSAIHRAHCSAILRYPPVLS